MESPLEKAPGSVACGGESSLDGICLSESDKTAVLTLIREEIITKEIEANEWKKKYEETRQEVLEMRLDWRFGEVWIPLCITIINANEVMKVLS